jgi:hypothetical protein
LLADGLQGGHHEVYGALGNDLPWLERIGSNPANVNFKKLGVFWHIWLLESPQGTKSPILIGDDKYAEIVKRGKRVIY